MESELLNRLRRFADAVPVFYFYFEPDELEPGPNHKDVLAEIAVRAAKFDGYLLIESFSPIPGDPAEARKVGEQRAAAVRDALKPALAGAAITWKSVSYGGRYGTVTTGADEHEVHLISVAMIERRQAKALNTAIKSAKAIMSGNDVTIGAPAAAKAVKEPGAEPAPRAQAPMTVSAPSAPPPVPASARVFYLYAPTAPATYNRLIYRAPAANGASAQYDRVSGAIPSKLGVGFEVQGSGAIFSKVAAGGRLRRYAPFTGTSSFPGSDKRQGLVEQTTAQAVGAWVDGYLMRLDFASGFQARAGAGLDFDYSTVTVKETYHDERVGTDDAAYSTKVTSNLGVLSLRLASRLGYYWAHLGADLNVNFQLPLTAAARSIVVPGDAEGWVKNLDHRAAVGSEIAFGLVYRI